MRRSLFFAIVLSLLGAVSLSAQDWTVLRFNGLDYVTLSSFCSFYQLPYDSPISNDVFRTRNAQTSVELHRDSREVKINGVRFWMSFGVLQLGHDWVISKLDLVKNFEPVLRPQMLDNKRIINGVVIDPGHGGADQGATNSRGRMEKNYTLDTAFRLEKILRSSGLKVVLTRRSDVFIPLYDRSRIANRYPDYLFVSVHFNQASEEARGLETYACSPRSSGSTQAGGRVSMSDLRSLPGNANDALNVLLGYEVQKQIIKLNPGDADADRGVKRARFVVIKQTALPGILVEGGFVSNRLEAALLDQPSYRQRLAGNIGLGIMNFIDKVAPVQKRVPVPELRPDKSPEQAAPAATASATLTLTPMNPAMAAEAVVKPIPGSTPSFGRLPSGPVIPTNSVLPPTPETKPAPQSSPPVDSTESPPATIIYGQAPVDNEN
jgi:N-acetylmuramoyl-L-alanine amidase